MVLFKFRTSYRSFKPDMPSSLFALHKCHGIACLFRFRYFFSFSVDRGAGVEFDYSAEPYTYPAGQGKRSPHISNPSFQSILLLIYCMRFKCVLLLELPIVACDTLPYSYSTAPSMTSFGLLRIARAVIPVCA